MFFFFYGHAAAVKISVGAEGKEVGLFSLVIGALTKTEAQISFFQDHFGSFCLEHKV